MVYECGKKILKTNSNYSELKLLCAIFWFLNLVVLKVKIKVVTGIFDCGLLLSVTVVIVSTIKIVNLQFKVS